MLSHDKSLEDRLARLLDNLAGTPTIAALGYRETDGNKVETNLARIGSRWKLFDARVVRAVDAEELVAKACATPLPVVVVRAPEPSREVWPLVKAAVEGQPRVQLAKRLVPRQAGQQVVLLIEGAKEMNDVAADWHVVPYWDFLP